MKKTWTKTLSRRELEKSIRKELSPPNRVHRDKTKYSRREKFCKKFVD